MEAEKKQKEIEKRNKMEHRKHRAVAMRSGPEKSEESKFTVDEDALMKPAKTLEDYEKLFAQNTEFYSTYNPDMIEEAIIELPKKEKKFTIQKANDKKYKLKLLIDTTDQSGAISNIQMQIRILNVDNSMVCVEFMRLEGDKQRFIEHYQEFKNELLKDMNDTLLE